MTTWGAIKTVFVLVGLPCAGKTSVVQRLRQEGDEIIERDAFLEEIEHDVQKMRELAQEASAISRPHSRAYPTLQQNALNDAKSLEYVRRITARINASKATRFFVDGLHLHPLSRSFVRSLQNASSIALVIDTEPAECTNRLKQLSHRTGIRRTLTPEMILRLAEITELPTLSEGFSKIAHVDPKNLEDLQSRFCLR